MKNKIRKMIIICIGFYLIFIWNTSIIITTKDWNYTIEKNGLLWVTLDYYTIIRYHSKDQPMKFIKYTKTKTTIKTLTEEYYDHILEGVDYGKVKNTVFKILSDISDRRGLRQEWEQIDEDIQNEIIQEWIDIVKINCI